MTEYEIRSNFAGRGSQLYFLLNFAIMDNLARLEACNETEFDYDTN